MTEDGEAPKPPSSWPAVAWDLLPMKSEWTPTCRQMGAELLWLKQWGVQGLGLRPPGLTLPSKECHQALEPSRSGHAEGCGGLY